MNFKLVWIFISLNFSIFGSEAAKIFNLQGNLYQGANFLNISNTLSDNKMNERSRGNQRENDNLIGISPVLLGNIVSRLAKLENFQKETEAKEVSREKFISRKVSAELDLLLKKNNTVSSLELASKKDLESEKIAELFFQVQTLSLRVEELALQYKSLNDKLSIFSSDLLELVQSVQTEKARRCENSKKTEELTALRVTDTATISKKIEELSARIASLALQVDVKKGNEGLEFFSVGTCSDDSLDSQNDDVPRMPSNRVETRAQSSESTPNLSFQ